MRDSDPVVLIVDASADTLTAGNKLLFEIKCWSVEGELQSFSISSFNEEQGQRVEKELPLSGRKYVDYLSIDTPSIKLDTLNHTVFLEAFDTRGDKATFVSHHVLIKPKSDIVK